MDFNFILLSVISLTPILVIGCFLLQRKKVTFDNDGIEIIDRMKTRKINWNEIKSVAGNSDMYLSGYKIKTTNNDIVTIPLQWIMSDWRKFEKELIKHSRVKLVAESWWPGVLWPKNKRWVKEGEEPMRVTVWDGMDLFFRPQYLFSKDSLQYIIRIGILLIPWIVLVEIINILK